MSVGRYSPRPWCNCMVTIRRLRDEQRLAKENGDERHEARVSSEIGNIDYAHTTGRCRFEYDPEESPIGPEHCGQCGAEVLGYHRCTAGD